MTYSNPKKRKMAAAVVKIDSDLLEQVKKFIHKKTNRWKYVNKKQFINLAVLDYLNKKRGKNRREVKNG